MNRHRIVTLVALSLLFLVPLTAEAAGTITGLDVSPKGPVTEGMTVNITINGTGHCDGLQLDYGDGKVQPFEDAPPLQYYDFPYPTSHVYNKAGTYLILAKGTKACQGQASAILTVKAPMFSFNQLCAKVDCWATLLSPPSIYAVTSNSNIEPGGLVVIVGKNFGNTPGEVFLKGLKKYNGEDIGPDPLFDLDWTDTGVAGTLSSYYKGVYDQQVTLQIKTQDNRLSNKFPVNFKAARGEPQLLLYTDPAVKLISCGTDSNKDACNEWTDPDDDNWFVYGCGHTFTGFHFNVWGAIGDDTDDDIFEITLKNGWVFDSMQLQVIVDPGEGSTSGPGGFPQGGTYWKPQVHWTVTPNDSLCHGAYVSIQGPKGVPWK